MLSDIEIAQATKLIPIDQLAHEEIGRAHV